MTNKQIATTILIAAVLIWATAFLIFSWSIPASLFTYPPIIVFIIIIVLAGLSSIRALAWALTLVGIFSFFLPFFLGYTKLFTFGEGMTFYWFFIYAGVNFILGLISAIISFLRRKH